MSYLEALMKNNDTEETQKVFKKAEPRVVEVSEKKNTIEDDIKNVVKDSRKNNRKPYIQKNRGESSRNPFSENKRTETRNQQSGPRKKESELSKAFEQAQTLIVEECKLDEETCSKIRTEFQYMVNPSYSVLINVSHDEIIVETDGKEYKFSKLRFLNNKHFQKQVIEQYNECNLGKNIWYKFIHSKRDQTKFYVRISMR